MIHGDTEFLPSADLETRQLTCFQNTGVGQALETGSRDSHSERENTEGRKEAEVPSSFQIQQGKFC